MTVNRSDECSDPCLVPDVKGRALSLLPLSKMLAMGLL